MDYNATVNLPKTDFPMRAGLPKREPEMLEQWNKIDVYGLLMKKNKGKPLFSLHDGPPFSNGGLHMGHALNKALKDFINRSYAMRGYYTPYIPGWDNHGMPIESAIIKEQKLNRKEMSVADFRTACHEYADKYIGTAEEWEKTESTMKKILDDLNIDYKEEWGEAAFYGPKLDVQGTNVYGKEDTLFTVQIDFALAERFDMVYVDENGEKVHPLIIHRSSIGCYERTLAMLIEKYAGAFPLWFAPIQARVMSLTDRTIDNAKAVADKLRYNGFRVEVDTRSEKIGKKIREAQLEKVPYMLIIGDKEAEQGVVAVRYRSEGDLGTMTLDDLMARMSEEVRTKKNN